MYAGLYGAVAQPQNAGLAIEGALVRIPFATVSNFRSLHDAPVHSAAQMSARL